MICILVPVFFRVTSLAPEHYMHQPINSSLPGQNGPHFADDIFKCIFTNEKFCILIWISLKFVSNVPTDNKSVLVQVMAWHQTGDKPLPELMLAQLTHWGRVTHICVGKLTNIGSDNGLSPGRRQAIIWTNAGILLIGPLGTNLSECLIVVHIFSFNKMHLKMSSAK